MWETNLAGDDGCCCIGGPCDHVANDAKKITDDNGVFAAEEIRETRYGWSDDSDAEDEAVEI